MWLRVQQFILVRSTAARALPADMRQPRADAARIKDRPRARALMTSQRNVRACAREPPSGKRPVNTC